jgi:ketosteroid isomerase-like protein
MSNTDLIDGIYKCFAVGDIPGVLGALDRNIEWTEAAGFPYGGTYVGPNAVLENVFMKIGTEWEGFSAVPFQLVDGGDTIVALGNYGGKYLKTGRSMSVPFVHVWDFEDGRIVKFVQHTDTLKVAEVL